MQGPKVQHYDLLKAAAWRVLGMVEVQTVVYRTMVRKNVCLNAPIDISHCSS